MSQSQEDSIVSSEDEELKANPFIPNAKAYWCPSCKAHHDYDYSASRSTHRTSTGSSTTSTYETFSCKVCGATMFCPGATVTPAYWLNGIGIICLAIGLGIGWSRGEFDFENGSELMFLGFAAIGLLIGGMMAHYMRKWVAWSFAQRKKSAEELEQEAMNAPSAAVRNSADKTEP